jgi:hypothetical protein
MLNPQKIQLCLDFMDQQLDLVKLDVNELDGDVFFSKTSSDEIFAYLEVKRILKFAMSNNQSVKAMEIIQQIDCYLNDEVSTLMGRRACVTAKQFIKETAEEENLLQ